HLGDYLWRLFQYMGQASQNDTGPSTINTQITTSLEIYQDIPTSPGVTYSLTFVYLSWVNRWYGTQGYSGPDFWGAGPHGTYGPPTGPLMAYAEGVVKYKIGVPGNSTSILGLTATTPTAIGDGGNGLYLGLEYGGAMVFPTAA